MPDGIEETTSGLDHATGALPYVSFASSASSCATDAVPTIVRLTDPFEATNTKVVTYWIRYF